jgi:multimeric flavodoxin WrbA
MLGLGKKKKKLLVLFASPHSHGYTSRLTQWFLHCFQQDNSWELELWDVFEKNPHPCTGCRVCAQQEGCSFSDLDDLDAALRESDLLVVASPVYNFSFPAPMKAVLDRTQRYFEARFSLGKQPPIKKHREAVLLLTMGSKEEFGVEVMTHQLRRAFTVMNTELTGCVVWSETDRGDLHRRQVQEQAEALALEMRDKP